ncbi:nadph dehydrogenase [Ophiostoma piceae UAMH 11346]|uniref:Nadph dehydrogenase n=1 Tax=Ophiostoma piceae (strain UAMH 11346) TaxID=1262450 RepID=S3D1Q7_OPHP1|nr:nadph dehydrogenase [Ophiostoma piceae UAMH 11346]
MSHPTAVTPRGATTISLPAPGVPFYTPHQDPVAGSPVADKDSKDLPTLFTPIKIRGVELANRFVVSPMCMYSADNGHLTDFHLVHLGQFALHGAGLTFIEATSITPNGRISPEDSGLWQDSQIAPIRKIVDFIHSQSHKVAIQLGHAGRKASMITPWMEGERGHHQYVTKEEGGWPDNTWSASAEPYASDWTKPHAMTVAEIDQLVDDFVAAAKRAVTAGVDIIEIHGAHGYLITQFLSPLTNKRTDDYGGSFENRIRLLTRVLAAVRAAIPDSMPLFLRVSATEWMEHAGAPSWTIAESIKLAALLPDLGVDLLDVSSGGNVREQQINYHPYFQANLAVDIKKALKGTPAEKLLLSVVGIMDNAEIVRDVTQKGGKVEADLVLAARQFLREPEFVQRVAHQLGVDSRWPKQYLRSKWAKNARI